MTRKLNDADRAAVDLVFDRILSAADGNGSNGNGHGGNDGVVLMTQSVSEERLSAVQRILGVLDTMPALEPPADLATRTLHRVARGDNAAMTSTAPGHFIDPSQPMA